MGARRFDVILRVLASEKSLPEERDIHRVPYHGHGVPRFVFPGKLIMIRVALFIYSCAAAGWGEKDNFYGFLADLRYDTARYHGITYTSYTIITQSHRGYA